MLTISLALLTGCDQIDDLKETVSGLTNPLVAQAMFLGVEEPDSEDIDLSETDWGDGGAATIWLADASSVDDMENAPVTGANVTVRVGETGSKNMNESGDGAYTLSGADGLEYTQGENTVIAVSIGQETSKLTMNLPPATTVELPESGNSGESMVVNLSSQEFDGMLAVVIDTFSGSVTWSNEPGDIQALYDFTHGDGASSFEIPAKAFPDDSVYAIGLAGLNFAEEADFDSVNTALSSFMVGKVKFYPYYTIELDSGM